MSGSRYLQGPYRNRHSSGLRALTQEAAWAFGGLAVAAYFVYALLV